MAGIFESFEPRRRDALPCACAGVLVNDTACSRGGAVRPAPAPEWALTIPDKRSFIAMDKLRWKSRPLCMQIVPRLAPAQCVVRHPRVSEANSETEHVEADSRRSTRISSQITTITRTGKKSIRKKKRVRYASELPAPSCSKVGFSAASTAARPPGLQPVSSTRLALAKVRACYAELLGT
jgi:hypothetical protein